MEITKTGINNSIQKNKRIVQKAVPAGINSLKSKSVSFTGVENVIADKAKTLFTEADKPMIDIFDRYYGNVGNRLGEKVTKLVNSSDALKKGARFSLDKGVHSIKDKNVGRSIVEHFFFPMINIPLYTANWVLKKAQAVPAWKDTARNIYNKPIFRVPRKLNELDTKTNIIKGIHIKTDEAINKFVAENNFDKETLIKQLSQAGKNADLPADLKKADNFIRENLYKVSNKFFDKGTGNFNTAFERPLNRIVSGLIPAAFLANDAYNLSVLCGDSKEVSQKEEKERRNQEIIRVFLTAYIQLLIFGAATKQVNNISWFTPLTSACTVLATEIASRKAKGKPAFFIGKKRAQKYHQKEQEKNKKTALRNKQKTQVEPQKQNNIKNQTNELSKTPDIFTSFKSTQKDQKTAEQKKTLINAKTFKKGVALLLVGGFALSFLKNSSYTKNSKLVQGVKSIGNFFKKNLYDRFTQKDFEIKTTDYNNIMTNLKEVGCEEIANGHEFIKDKYGRTVNDVLKMAKAKLSSGDVEKAVTESLQNLKDNNINIKTQDIETIKSAVKIAVKNNKESISEFKFKDVANQTAKIMQNKKVSIAPENLSMFAENLEETLAKNAKEEYIKMNTFAKPFIDAVIQPFKFIGSALRLPYKIVSSVIKAGISASHLKDKAKAAELGVTELKGAGKVINKVATEIFGESHEKSGDISQKIFANAMERFAKKTKPYEKAKQVLKNAGTPAETEKAQQVLGNKKEKLLKYVNTAVENSFNEITFSKNKNTDLAMMSKIASSALTSVFLVADNHNMVLIKSNGEDKQGAKEAAIDRVIQRISSMFYSTLLINWFNTTFMSLYNHSLKGMAAVVIPCTITGEILTRKSIGMPVRKKSFEELQANEEKNENRKGFLGKYFKFMRLLTGKKPLKDRMPKNQTKPTSKPVMRTKIVTSQKNTTNLIEKYSK